MECPFCLSKNVDVPMVDIGVGEEQCGPAICLDCNAAQDDQGAWHDWQYWSTRVEDEAFDGEGDEWPEDLEDEELDGDD